MNPDVDLSDKLDSVARAILVLYWLSAGVIFGLTVSSSIHRPAWAMGAFLGLATVLGGVLGRRVFVPTLAVRWTALGGAFVVGALLEALFYWVRVGW